MALLKKLKSLFGLGGGGRPEREGGVTVEREPAAEAVEPETEAAVTEPGEPESEPGGTTAAEPAVEPATGAESEAAGESPDVLSGIGPAYAERLADAGVETVGDLAGADAGALADATDISETRLQGWIEAAEDHLTA